MSALDDALAWHARGKAASPNADSVRHTQTLIDEIERLRSGPRLPKYRCAQCILNGSGNFEWTDATGCANPRCVMKKHLQNE